ncbi:unnamed protein product [Lactuca virosa]|uniref:Telomeric single stranded DNA binding POT1/Cdc13 domain-containing protein n=1 Tax=Lactuca virosa TaxID=75947 RepID=A0AAU9NG08_9ASTR|nr:unnamed protein product [Lactuca virosa]
MPNPESDDYKFLRIVDATTSINQKVNLIGVVTEAGIPKQSKGTDCCCTIRIVDESNPSSGISVNVFAETFDKLPNVESTGDIIQLSHVVMKLHGSEVNAVFNKRFSAFALYEGSDFSNFVPYQVSSKFHAREQDNKFIADLRKWTITHLPETESNGFFQLNSIKQGIRSNLICKVLHICEVTQGEWMLFVWNGTDAPPLDIHSKLEEELKNPLCLQLEEPPLSRDVLCSFPTVGTVLRLTADRCNARLALQLLKVGRWVQFRNIQFEAREGLWCGILMHSSKFSYLSDDNKVVLEFQREYKKRFKGKWTRMPLSSFPWPPNLTKTEHEHVPLVTLMDIITYPKVLYKYRCVVRVVATLPGEATNFRGPSGIYRLRLTLEDATARIHACLYDKDAEKFFGGYPDDDKMIKLHKVLLGIDENNGKARNPPWIDCCLKSYYVDKSDMWGSRRYGIFDTKFIGLSD